MSETSQWTTRFMVEVTFPATAGEAPAMNTTIVDLFHRVTEDLAADRPEWQIATFTPQVLAVAEPDPLAALCTDQDCQYRNQPLGRHPAKLTNITGRTADSVIAEAGVDHPRRPQ